MSDQSPEPRRRRVVRRAAAPPPAAPPAAEEPTDVTEPETVEDDVTDATLAPEPETVEDDATAGEDETEDDETEDDAGSAPERSATVDLGAELAELASAPRRRAVRKTAPPVSAAPDIKLPGDDSPEDAEATDEAPAKKTARKTAAKKTAARSTAKQVAADDATDDAPSADAPSADAPDAEAPGDETPAGEDAPPAKKAAKRTAKKATKRTSKQAADADQGDEAAETPSQDGAQDETATEAGKDAPRGAGRGGSKSSDRDAESGSPRLATTALLFQPPDPSLAKPKRRRVTADAGSPQAVRDQVDTGDEDAVEDEQDDARDDSPRGRTRGGRGRGRGADRAADQDDAETDDDQREDTDGEDAETDDAQQGGSGGSRRRRRRGGRGRRGRGSSDDSASSDHSSDDDEANDQDSDAKDSSGDGASQQDESKDSDGESGSGRRRRRRRSRSGRSGDGDGSSRSDEPTALRGSTRLEAKRQRRREGRDAGRRRQILTEAEFLARRESVERSMVVREVDGRTQIAVLEDGVLAEHYVSRTTQASMVGNVYLGRVQNVLPSMEAAFVDVGKGRNAVLYAGEVNWDAAGLEGQPRRIETALKSGDSVLVQVTKDPIGHKGARLTAQITLAGRYLVFVPGAGMTGISRKLPEKERARLKKLLREIVPENSGVIVRTAAEGASEEELRADIERLSEQWAKIEKKAKTASAPSLLQGEADLAIRVVRDIFNDDFSSLVVQGASAWKTISTYVEDLAPDLRSKLSRWTSEKDVFAEHRIDEQIAKAMDRKVWLPSGGSLVIDRTEAMTVVDVNTGKFTGAGGTLEETVTRNNLEAAEEIVRQLRLRDIGGIIVIDFIDMVLESNRDLVLRRLVECLGRDRTKHQVAEVTSLGLVQMTRKRVGQGLLEAFSEKCDHCSGLGYVVHDHPVGKGEQQNEGSNEPKKSRRSRKAAAKEAPAHPAVPVLPAEREKVNATLAAIAAAAAHAHEAEAEADGGKEAGESSQEAPASQDATTAGTPAASAPGSEDEAAPAEVGTPRDEA